MAGSVARVPHSSGVAWFHSKKLTPTAPLSRAAAAHAAISAALGLLTPVWYQSNIWPSTSTGSSVRVSARISRTLSRT